MRESIVGTIREPPAQTWYWGCAGKGSPDLFRQKLEARGQRRSRRIWVRTKPGQARGRRATVSATGVESK